MLTKIWEHSRISSVIAKHLESICVNSYSENESGRHCLLGWLAVEAGIPLPEADFNSNVLGMDGTKQFADSLEREYGIPFESLKKLQFANDDQCDSDELLKRINKILEKIKESSE